MKRLALFLILFTCSRAVLAQGFIYSFLGGHNCAPATVSFTDTSIGIVSVQWDFGSSTAQPATSIQKNPFVIYNTCGTYTVTLTTVNTKGVTKTVADIISIACPPVASFLASPTSGCQPLLVQYSSTASTAGSGVITNYQWDFCDGDTSGKANPVHVFGIPSCYCTKLKVTNSAGCMDDTTINNYICVLANPVPKINTTNPPFSCTSPYTVNFDGTGSSPTGISYQWTFPGGSPSSSGAPTPSVTYNSPGSYDVTLVVTSPNGCTTSLTLAGYVNIGTNAITIQPVNATICEGDTLQFVTFPGAISYLWAISPGSISFSGTDTMMYVFSTAGTYTVSCVVTYPGCTATAHSTINVTPASACVTGIKPMANESSVGDFYPNPASEVARLDYRLKPGEQVTLTLMDVLGRKAGEYLLDNNSEVFELNTSSLQSGIYFCTIKNEKGVLLMEKILVNH